MFHLVGLLVFVAYELPADLTEAHRNFLRDMLSKPGGVRDPDAPLDLPNTRLIKMHIGTHHDPYTMRPYELKDCPELQRGDNSSHIHIQCWLSDQPPTGQDHHLSIMHMMLGYMQLLLPANAPDLTIHSGQLVELCGELVCPLTVRVAKIWIAQSSAEGQNTFLRSFLTNQAETTELPSEGLTYDFTLPPL